MGGRLEEPRDEERECKNELFGWQCTKKNEQKKAENTMQEKKARVRVSEWGLRERLFKELFPSCCLEIHGD